MKKISCLFIAVLFIKSAIFTQVDTKEEGATFNFNKKQEPLSRKKQFNFTTFYGFPHLEKALFKQSLLADSTLETFNFKEINVKGIGPLGLRGEYFLNNYIGLGFDFVYNQYQADFVDEYEMFDFPSQSLVTVQDVYRYTMKRFRFQVKCNIHFKMMNPKWDVYTGLGLGYSYRVVDFLENGISNLEAKAELQSQTNLFPYYIRTSFGARYYFTRNIGFNAEIGIGGPLISTGIVFRFNQKY